MKKTPSMAELTETPENIAAQKGGPLEIDLTGIVRRRVKGWAGEKAPDIARMIKNDTSTTARAMPITRERRYHIIFFLRITITSS